ncbi:hypothetical protein F511_26338 [Dorcoceras hygrometricum]|uniref:Uncharacterized protein n=1 Tax=Dorcoceras hygrometricum TaxID=472368 RepID=A0A2Z7A9H0_9LAMI|nr:hypothetical protein F511_26338 [Dorcoceras hygrometricum]
MRVQPWRTTTDQRATICTRGCRPVAPITRPARDMKRHHRAAASSGAAQHRATSGDLRIAVSAEQRSKSQAGTRDGRAYNRAAMCSKCASHRARSVQYGPFNPYIPIRSTTIGKSRVAKDPIAILTSWRSNSDIASVTSIGYPRMSASVESSTTMHRLLHASGSHPIPPPDDPNWFLPAGLLLIQLLLTSALLAKLLVNQLGVPCISGSKLLYQLGSPLTVPARYLRPVQLRRPLTVPVWISLRLLQSKQDAHVI